MAKNKKKSRSKNSAKDAKLLAELSKDSEEEQEEAAHEPKAVKKSPKTPPPASSSSKNHNNVNISITLEQSEGPNKNILPGQMMPSEDQELSSQLLKQTWENYSAAKKQNLEPRPVQLMSWPVLLPRTKPKKSKTIDNKKIINNNLMAIAPTGSGKTLSYGIPLLIDCILQKDSCGLVLTPTRELAQQIQAQLSLVVPCLLKSKAFDKHKMKQQIKVVGVYGGKGVDKDDQIDLLCSSSSKKAIVVVATPGRLLDLLTTNEDHKRAQKALTKTNTVRTVVLDEADRLAKDKDMVEQINEILGIVASIETTTRVGLFSATHPKSVNGTWNEWAKRPRMSIKINTTTLSRSEDTRDKDPDHDGAKSERTKRKPAEGGDSMEVSTIPSHVTQTFHYCLEDSDKTLKVVAQLVQIRKQEYTNRARRKGLCMIFFNRIKDLESVHKLLRKDHRADMKWGVLHGKKDQSTRSQTLADFKCGKIPTLLCTDVATRGIHVNNVEYVLNHDMPETLDQYVHRCGRAGRTQKAGKAPPRATIYSYYTKEIAPLAASLVALLKASNSAAEIPSRLVEMAANNPASDANPPPPKKAKKESE